MRRKAIVYIRVSTDEQAEKGYSLKHQLEKLQRFCEFQNIEVAAVFNEDYSAKTFDRPEFNKILQLVRGKKLQADMILFTKWDRFSRNAGDAYMMINTLKKLGIEPQAMEQPLDLTVPENKIMLAVYLAAPEVENDRRALNVIAGMRRAKKEGRWMTQAPKGYRNARDEKGNKVIVPTNDAPLIKWIFEELSMGIHNVVEVWRMAKKKGFKTSKNNMWFIIRNPVYTGKIFIPAYKDEPVFISQGLHEPIISEELYHKVQDILDGRKRTVCQKNKKKAELPLRGHLICKRCGEHLSGSASRGNGGRYFYYHCIKGCKERVKAEYMNSTFVNGLSKLAPLPGVMDFYLSTMKKAFLGNGQDRSQQLQNIKKEIEKVQERIDRAQNLMLDGKLDASDYKEIKNRLQPEIEKLQRNMSETAITDVRFDSYLEDGLFMLKNLGEAYQSSDLEIKHKIIGSIFPEKLIFEEKSFRTNAFPKALSRLVTIGAGNKRTKKRTEEIFLPQSRMVARAGFEPT